MNLYHALPSVTPGLTRGSAAFGWRQEAKPRVKSGVTMFVGYRRYPNTRHAELISASMFHSARMLPLDGIYDPDTSALETTADVMRLQSHSMPPTEI